MKRTQKHIAMEDKQLNAAESIALISRMIDNTRNRMLRNSGRAVPGLGLRDRLHDALGHGCGVLFPESEMEHPVDAAPRTGRIADVADTRQAYRRQSQHVRRPRHQQRMAGDGPHGVVRQHALAFQPDTAADPVHHPADDGHGNHDHGADHPVPPGHRGVRRLSSSLPFRSS